MTRISGKTLISRDFSCDFSLGVHDYEHLRDIYDGATPSGTIRRNPSIDCIIWLISRSRKTLTCVRIGPRLLTDERTRKQECELI